MTQNVALECWACGHRFLGPLAAVVEPCPNCGSGFVNLPHPQGCYTLAAAQAVDGTLVERFERLETAQPQTPTLP